MSYDYGNVGPQDRGCESTQRGQEVQDDCCTPQLTTTSGNTGNPSTMSHHLQPRFYIHMRVGREVEFTEISGCGLHHIVPPALGNQELRYSCSGSHLGGINLMYYNEYFDYYHSNVGGFLQQITVEIVDFSEKKKAVGGGPLKGRRFSIYLFLDSL